MKRRDFITLLCGAITAWPRALRAQRKATPVIGFLSGRSPGEIDSFLAAFRQGLSDNGYVEGHNLAIEYRWALGDDRRFPALAAELVRRKLDLIVSTGGNAAALALKNATATIPIVFFTGGDPVGDGLVASLARPGGNLTGVTIQISELIAKRLELLCELVPQATVIAVLVNPNSATAGHLIRAVEGAARAKVLELRFLKATSEGEIDAAFANLAGLHADALILDGNTFFRSRHAQLAALASRYTIPTIGPWPDFTGSGGLISYAASSFAAIRKVGVYAGRILKGEKPADLPVQQPTTFELVINLKTAKALGLTVPQSLLARADEVIE